MIFFHDMGERPQGMCIERIDNNGDYGRGNCKWATAKEQARNRRDNVELSADGVEGCLTEVCEAFYINRDVVRWRVNDGWSHTKALRAPVKQKHTLEFQGRELQIFEWCRLFGISKSTLLGRLSRGWSIERALTVAPRNCRRPSIEGGGPVT